MVRQKKNDSIFRLSTLLENPENSSHDFIHSVDWPIIGGQESSDFFVSVIRKWNRAVFGSKSSSGIWVRFSVGKRSPRIISHHCLDPLRILFLVICPVSMGVVGIGREEKRLFLSFGLVDECSGEINVFLWIPAHSGFNVSSPGRDTETTPFRPMFSDQTS